MAEYQGQVAQKYGLKSEALEQAYEGVISRVNGIKTGVYTPGADERARLVKISKLSGKALIDEIGQLAHETRVMTRVYEIVDKIDPNLKNETKGVEVMQVAFAEIANPYAVSEPTDEELITLLKARFDLSAAKPPSEGAVGPKGQGEKPDDVQIVKDVDQLNEQIEEAPLTAEQLQSW